MIRDRGVVDGELARRRRSNRSGDFRAGASRATRRWSRRVPNVERPLRFLAARHRLVAAITTLARVRRPCMGAPSPPPAAPSPPLSISARRWLAFAAPALARAGGASRSTSSGRLRAGGSSVQLRRTAWLTWAEFVLALWPRLPPLSISRPLARQLGTYGGRPALRRGADRLVRPSSSQPRLGRRADAAASASARCVAGPCERRMAPRRPRRPLPAGAEGGAAGRSPPCATCPARPVLLSARVARRQIREKISAQGGAEPARWRGRSAAAPPACLPWRARPSPACARG